VAYTEGIFTGYRYYDAGKVAPRFPFGFGLSYTRFSYSNIKTVVSTKLHSPEVTVRFTIKNTGAYDGAEVAQVYVHDVATTVPRPYKELKGFAKVFLKKGESRVVTVKLDADAFSYFKTAQHRFGYDPGSFDILVGSSAATILLKSRVMVP
jgi:beta-glucosidase